MLFTSTVLAVIGFTSCATAHMLMAQPVPFGKSTLNNSPLNGDGSDFPCKLRSNTFDKEGANNVMPLGSSQPLAFTGSAVHGGGSCQLSITYDATPSKSSVWKVIYSIEGGCPMRGVAGNNGNDAAAVDPSTYTFPIPNNIPTGNAVLAWTWFNKIGNREMYMNCAPITLTAGSARRDEDEIEAQNVTQLMERDVNAYNALPDMFVANLGGGCGTKDSTDLLFPNRGNFFEQDGLATKEALATPTGPSCGAQIAATAAPFVASTPAAAATTAASLPGGVFVTSPAGAPTVVASTAAASAAPSSAAPSAAPKVSPIVSAPAAASPSAAPVTPASTGGTPMVAGTACTPEGMWNCMGTSFQRCASGTWSVIQAMAAGTKCTVGSGMAMDVKAASAKRSIRFSPHHLRRHIERSS